MMLASVYGRLGGDPKVITTKSGKPMTVCSIAVELTDRSGEATTQWLGVVTFGRVADDLARHEKGDPIGVSGRVQRNNYTTPGGERREELQVIADSVVSARTVRPGGKRRASGAHSESVEPAGPPSVNEGAPFNDALPPL
jgi:single-strand DNA-binding protein